MGGPRDGHCGKVQSRNSGVTASGELGIAHDEKFLELRPSTPAAGPAHGDGDRFLLPDQDHQSFAACHAGIEQIALQHRVVLGDDGDDHGWIFGALRFMDGRRVRQHDLIEFSERVGDRPAVEVDRDNSFLGINGGDEPDIAVEGLLLVVVGNLHDLVAHPIGEAEPLDGRALGMLGIEGRLQVEVQ